MSKQDIFDVAKWSRNDIEIVMTQLGVETTETENFIDAVIDELDSQFDGNIGICWDVIELAVETVRGDFDA